MLYQIWNLRCIPFFKEEIANPKDDHASFPSINDFRQPNVYTPTLRQQLYEYINGCPAVIATTWPRKNAYTGKREMELAYFTDGEIIFNNLLHHYIREPDFALPERWLEIIRQKNFNPGPLTIDAAIASNATINIFRTTNQGFEEIPVVRQAVRK
ncbi:hypothetical protein ECE50_005695 [Chitinophaga sp. Mgbs1]|uniref:Uncharacterized protein n=1 Tax=Chitinophaga solisilvae TaxID=1233460 RepID=A0A433W9Y0_9BACT|nr:hypothetical protein [Chitinophaga solisilvae]